MAEMNVRTATAADLPAIEAIMGRAIPQLLKGFLTAEQVAASVEIMGLDRGLVADGTYLIAEIDGKTAGCGGWSRRATTHGGDRSPGRDARLLDPGSEPARVRAMYTDPWAARRGVGRAILAEAEKRAFSEGFTLGMLVATLAGEPLYRACGWREVKRWTAETSGGVGVPVLTMEKALG